jgi:hypothetical protein
MVENTESDPLFPADPGEEVTDAPPAPTVTV